MKTCPTIEIKICIAGAMADIERACRKFCERGLCVSVTPATFVFCGGAEPGAIVGLMNYPRFSSTEDFMWQHGLHLAGDLLMATCQRSCSVVCKDETYYVENPNLFASVSLLGDADTADKALRRGDPVKDAPNVGPMTARDAEIVAAVKQLHRELYVEAGL